MMSTTDTILTSSGAVAVLLLDDGDQVLERASATDEFAEGDARSVAQQIADLRASMLTDEDEFTIVWSNDASLNVLYRKVNRHRAVAVVFRSRSQMATVRAALTTFLKSDLEK